MVPLVGCEVADVTRFVAFFTRDITPIPGVVTSIRGVLSERLVDRRHGCDGPDRERIQAIKQTGR